MQAIKLKPCPFCGKRVYASKGVPNSPFYFFKCINPACGAVVSFDNAAANMSPAKAIENYNGRNGHA